MAQVLCFTRPVSLSRKNGTLAVSQGEETPRLLPLLQISEIFALGGVAPDPALLSLLSETRTPLHCFGPSGYEGSWMPYQGLLAGRTAQFQYEALCDERRRRELGLRLIKAALLLRLAWVRQVHPDEEEHWEELYLGAFREAQVYPQRPLRHCLEAARAIDDQRRRAWRLSKKGCRNASDLGLALTIGTFANLSLDPWCSLITEGHSFPLARDLAFLLEPCFVEAALSVRGGLPERIENCAESFQLRLKRPFARDRGRIWSLRTLPLREAYLLLGAIRGGGIYRPAWNVEVKDHEAVGSP